MSEKPIIFNAEMVRAILAGEKTHTRRPVKPQPPQNAVIGFGITDKGKGRFMDFNSAVPIYWKPPCAIGDLLYVRETWADLEDNRDSPYLGIGYRATAPEYYSEVPNFRWRPSIHMPKKYARIWLSVLNITVERLQAMTPRDAHEEGIRIDKLPPACNTYLREFRRVWEECYGTESWDRNPWVWNIEFRRIERK